MGAQRGPDLEELPVRQATAVFEPGRRFHYSNLGYGLLGEVLAGHRACSWDEAVVRWILRPLGMDRTTVAAQAPAADGWAVHPWADVLLPEPAHHHGALAGAGQLWSTVADLGRLASFVASDGGDVLASASLEEMTEPGAVEPAPNGWWAYGLGLQIHQRDGRRLVGHGGSMPGFQAGLLVDRATGDAAVTMRNATGGSDGGMVGELLDLVAAHEPHPGPPWVPAAPLVPLGVLGPWYWGPMAHVLRAVGAALVLEPWGQAGGRTTTFRRCDDGRWVGRDGYFAGEELVLTDDRLTVATFVFTRGPYAPDEGVPGRLDAGGWR